MICISNKLPGDTAGGCSKALRVIRMQHSGVNYRCGQAHGSHIKSSDQDTQARDKHVICWCPPHFIFNFFSLYSARWVGSHPLLLQDY